MVAAQIIDRGHDRDELLFRREAEGPAVAIPGTPAHASGSPPLPTPALITPPATPHGRHQRRGGYRNDLRKQILRRSSWRNSKRSIRFGSAQVGLARSTFAPPSLGHEAESCARGPAVNAHSLNGGSPSTNGRQRRPRSGPRCYLAVRTPYRSTPEPLPTKQTCGVAKSAGTEDSLTVPESRTRDCDRPRAPVLPRTPATLAWRISSERVLVRKEDRYPILQTSCLVLPPGEALRIPAGHTSRRMLGGLGALGHCGRSSGSNPSLPEPAWS